MKKGLTITKRLVIGFGVLSLATLISMLVFYRVLSDSKKATISNTEIYTPSVTFLNSFQQLISESNLLIKNWVFIDKRDDSDEKARLRHIIEFEYDSLKMELLNLSGNNWEIENQQLLTGIFTITEDTLFPYLKHIMEQLNSFESYNELTVIFEVSTMVEPEGEISQTVNEVLKQINVLQAEINHKAQKSNQKMLSSLSFISTFFVIIGIFLVGIAIVSTYITVRSIINPLKFLKENINIIGSGDFSRSLENNRKDEVGQMLNSLNEMKNSISLIVSEIKAGSNNVAQNSREVNQSSENISLGSNKQTLSTQEASSTMEQMTATTLQNAENAQQTEKIALQVANDVKIVSSSMEETSKAMKDISTKISIINDIAFQTNILALNAAVEAARAGEHGRGFAVVAAEVRKLAERSKTAANDIVDVSKNGVVVADKAKEQLFNIVPEIQKTSQLVQEISAASAEQGQGIVQVSNTIQNLSSITEQNYASANALTNNSKELLNQSELLRESITFFKIKDN